MVFWGLKFGRNHVFRQFWLYLPPPMVYMVRKPRISASIWHQAIKIWCILQAVRILVTDPDRLLNSSWHCVVPATRDNWRKKARIIPFLGNLYCLGEVITFGVQVIIFWGKFWFFFVLFSSKNGFCEVSKNTPESYGMGLSLLGKVSIETWLFFYDGLP